MPEIDPGLNPRLSDSLLEMSKESLDRLNIPQTIKDTLKKQLDDTVQQARSEVKPAPSLPEFTSQKNGTVI